MHAYNYADVLQEKRNNILHACVIVSFRSGTEPKRKYINISHSVTFRKGLLHIMEKMFSLREC